MTEQKTITTRIDGKLAGVYDQLIDRGFTTSDLVRRGLWLVAKQEGIKA